MESYKIHSLIMRCKAFLKEAEKHIWQEIHPIRDMEYLVCGEHSWDLLFDEKQNWQPLRPLEGLGAPDQHYGIRVSIPPLERSNNPHYLQVQTGATDIWNYNNPQFFAYLDDRLCTGLDMNHTHIQLPNDPEPEAHTVKLYLYSNTTYPDIFLDLRIVECAQEIQGLYYDLLIPLELLEILEDADPAKAQVAEILFNALQILDTREWTGQHFYDSIAKARSYLADRFYQATLEEHSLVLHSIGSTHIDVAWLWTVNQTREKSIRSVSSALHLMEAYPEYRFLFSQAQLYAYLKEDQPGLYQQIVEKVHEGRWEVEGASWVEPDTNLPSGESLVRQILYGKRFFRVEFGVVSEVLWLPDAFGFTASLPQLMKLAGVKYFSTTKIGWNDTNRFPYDSFYWEGIDGSQVLAHFITTTNFVKYPTPQTDKQFSTTYNGTMEVKQLAGSWQRYQNKPLNRDLLQVFGWGDGGGGPTRDMLERQRRLIHPLPRIPHIKRSSVGAFFHTLEARTKIVNFPVWKGEIPLEYHRGTLTTVSDIKKLNRQTEAQLVKTEFLCALTRFFGHKNRVALEEEWQVVLRNQFHDILPGTAIAEVYKVAAAEYREVLRRTNAIIQERLQILTDAVPNESDGVLLVNPHGFPITGKHVESIWTDIRVPSLGWTFIPSTAANKKTIKHTFDTENLLYENPFLRIRFLSNGQIAGLYDKEAGRDILPQNTCANRLRLFQDIPLEYDAWNTEIYAHDRYWEIDQNKSLTCKYQDDRKIVLHFEESFGRSSLQQEIVLYVDRRVITFDTTVDWHEAHLFLKVDFPLDLEANQAQCDIQFGNISRSLLDSTPQERAQFEVLAHKWVDISESDYGCAIFNDCKYGYHLREQLVRMSLLRSSKYPDPEADMGVHHFRYALYPHLGHWRKAEVIEEAIMFNQPCWEIPVAARNQISSDVPLAFSLLQFSEPNLQVECVTLAQATDEIIIRVYESLGQACTTRLKVPESVRKIRICDLLESVIEELPMEDLHLRFGPYEIKTLKLSYQESNILG